MPSCCTCCTCCTAVSIVRRKTLPLWVIRSRSAGGADPGRPRSALGLTVQARTAARILVPAGFSMRSSSRPSTVQVTVARTHRADDLRLASWPVAHQPFKSPRQLTYTSGTPSGKAAYRGSGTARAKPVHGPSEPSWEREIGAADDDETDRDGTSCRRPRAALSTRCECPMVHPLERPGTQLDDEFGALPSRFIGQNLAGLGDGIGIDRVTFVTRFAPCQMPGKVQDPLTGDGSTDAPGTEDAECRARENQRSAPRRPVSGAISWTLRCSRSRTRYAPSRLRPRLRQIPAGRLHLAGPAVSGSIEGLTWVSPRRAMDTPMTKAQGRGR